MSYIILEQQKIPFHEIKESIKENHFSLYSKGILAFCAEWLSKNATFEIYTSGSTGVPKRILWTREMILWSIKNTVQALGLKKNMHCLHCIDANKAGGKMMLARALTLGMSLEVIAPSSNPLLNCISKHFDFAAMVPLQIHTLYNNGQLKELEKIDTLIIGGASLNQSLADALQNIKTKIYTSYGMTETASHIALKRINGDEKQEYFIPFDDVNISISDDGCLVINTPFHHRLATHDMVKIHSENSLEITGRNDNMINSGGYKISLEKIEAALDKALTSLKINFFNYCAYKQPDEKLGEALVVIFETKSLEESMMDELKKELSPYLEKYELPKHFYFTDKLEFTVSGKIDRKKSWENTGEK